ncbi:MAG: pyruvate ferredoxin oxidoreductase [Acidihalobacter sp.]
MPQALEGSQAVARAVALCRPQVVSAYPITPQTHIVENIAKLVADGQLDCEYVSVESEHSAASVVLGAAAAGARAYTASASQGILLMCEVLYDISGLRVPLVLTCANRALSGPISIWNDQSDSMAVRDAGWIQLYCTSNQEAVDTHIQAFRIAQETELPVMVCMDGFTLTHTLEPLDLPPQRLVDDFLPPFRFARMLDPQAPLSLGTMVGPEAYSELRHSNHQALIEASDNILNANADWAEKTGRDWGGLLRSSGPEDARIGLLGLGSLIGTLQDAALAHPELPATRIMALRAFRPFPIEALQAACEGLDELVVIERAFSPGSGAIVAAEVRAALSELPNAPRVHAVAVGLGGRDIGLDLYPRLLEVARGERAERFRILDLNPERLPQELRA